MQKKSSGTYSRRNPQNDLKKKKTKEKTVLHLEYSFFESFQYCAHVIMYGYVGYLLAQFEKLRRTPNIANVAFSRCFVCDRTAFPFFIFVIRAQTE